MKVYSIFLSIDGEISYPCQGQFSTFLRLSGCNLDCAWCDTKKAQNIDSGRELSNQQIFEQIKNIGCKKITITGGEPLLQLDSIYELMLLLKNWGAIITVETNGSILLPKFEKQGIPDSWIVDYKLPSSKMQEFMQMGNFMNLQENDIIKFVIDDRGDYDSAVEVLKKFDFKNYIKKAFSPTPNLSPQILIDWMKQDRLFQVVLSLQLHKIIWPNANLIEV